MKASRKAILLSALVFPGAGQIYVKRYILGLPLVGGALASLLIILYYAFERAQKISEQIIMGDIPPDLPIIMDMVVRQSAEYENLTIEIASYVLVFAWLLGICEALYANYRCTS